MNLNIPEEQVHIFAIDFYIKQTNLISEQDVLSIILPIFLLLPSKIKKKTFLKKMS